MFYMREIFEKFNISITNEQLNLFDKYYQLLVEYNEKFNITTIIEKQEVYKKHFVDSILGLEEFCGKTLIDVGSGGGFPAIPIKIMKDDLDVTLLEATGKKCTFLNAVIDGLQLKNIKVINARAEDLAKNPNFREKFSLCSARAVARLNTLCEYCLPFVEIGGKFISYKANAEDEIIEAKNAIKTLGGKINKVKNYNLEDAMRTLIVIDKISSTDKKYPRGNGKERKNPL